MTSDRRPKADRLFDLCRAVVLVYGGFLLGMLTHAWWEHDELVFWPWSLVFLLMVAGLVLWRNRRAPKVRERVDG